MELIRTRLEARTKSQVLWHTILALNYYLLLCFLLLPVSLAAQQDTASRTVDYQVLKTLQDHRTPVGNTFWVAVSNTFVLSPAVPVSLGVGSWVSSDPQTEQTLFANASEAGGAWLLNAGLTMGLKFLVGRPRPWVAYKGDLVCLQHVGSPSFPSGHTSFAFTAATSLSLLYPRWYVIAPAFLWASAVGFSRLYVGAHYPSDVLAGALIGTGSALLVHWLHQRYIRQNTPFSPPPDAVVIPIVLTF